MIVRVGPFSVSGANLDGNSLCCGVPSPLAALGFADALARQAAELPAPTAEVAMIVHDCQVSEGQIKPSPTASGNGRIENTEIPQRVIGFVTATLILSNMPEMDLTALRRVTPAMRFCGAPIFPMGDAFHIPVEVFDDKNPHTLFGRLPRGFALLPRPDLAPLAFGAEAEIDALCDGLIRARPSRKQSLDQDDSEVTEGGESIPDDLTQGESVTRTLRNGWIVPVPVGYRALQPLATAKPRKNSRDGNVPHIFAEDAAGLAEFASIRRLSREEASSSDAFWRWVVDRQRGLFLASSGYLTAPQSNWLS